MSCLIFLPLVCFQFFAIQIVLQNLFIMRPWHTFLFNWGVVENMIFISGIKYMICFIHLWNDQNKSNIHHLTLLQFVCACVMRVFKNYTQQFSNIQYSTVNYNHHSIHYISRTYLSIVGSLYLVTTFTHRDHQLPFTSGTPQSVVCINEFSYLFVSPKV